MARDIYLDNASSTPVDPRVARVVERASLLYGNPSSLNDTGRKARTLLEDSRKKVSKILGAPLKAAEIVFTASGTESNNLAIIGTALANKKRGKHIIVSNIEHKSVLSVCDYLQKNEGFSVTRLKADRSGLINVKSLQRALRKDTILVSVIYANNEIGTIQPIREISNILRKHRNRPIFHTDACQAPNHLNLNVNDLGIDLMSLNSSKVYGPRGVAALYIRTGVEISPQLHGGEQERGLRSATENVAGIAGFAKALELAEKYRKRESLRLTKLRDHFISEVTQSLPRVIINGHLKKRLPNNINLSIPGINGEFLVLNLDKYKIRASSGSACQVHGSSHVLQAIGINDAKFGTIRFSLGKNTTKEDLDYVLKILPKAIEKSKLG